LHDILKFSSTIFCLKNKYPSLSLRFSECLLCRWENLWGMPNLIRCIAYLMECTMCIGFSYCRINSWKFLWFCLFNYIYSRTGHKYSPDCRASCIRLVGNEKSSTENAHRNNLEKISWALNVDVTVSRDKSYSSMVCWIDLC